MRVSRSLGPVLAGLLLAGCYGAPAASGPSSTGAPSALPVAAASLDPGDAATNDPLATIDPTTVPTATVEPTPAPTPRPQPSVELLVNGVDGDPQRLGFETGDSIDVELSLVTEDLRRSDCEIDHRIDPDVPKVATTTVSLPPRAEQTVSLIDGWHRFTVRCPSIDGELTATVEALAADGLPERCKGFDLPEEPLAVSSVAELEAGIVGDWQGCVTTPWWPVYWVEMSFRADGTYSATATEVLDDWHTRGIYYGIEDEDPGKQWRIADVQDGVGTGQLDIVFEGGNAVTDDLTGIRLTADTLRFEFLHLDTYGPLVYRLVRT